MYFQLAAQTMSQQSFEYGMEMTAFSEGSCASKSTIELGENLKKWLINGNKA